MNLFKRIYRNKGLNTSHRSNTRAGLFTNHVNMIIKTVSLTAVNLTSRVHLEEIVSNGDYQYEKKARKISAIFALLIQNCVKFE